MYYHVGSRALPHPLLLPPSRCEESVRHWLWKTNVKGPYTQEWAKKGEGRMKEIEGGRSNNSRFKIWIQGELKQKFWDGELSLEAKMRAPHGPASLLPHPCISWTPRWAYISSRPRRRAFLLKKNSEASVKESNIQLSYCQHLENTA